MSKVTIIIDSAVVGETEYTPGMTVRDALSAVGQSPDMSQYTASRGGKRFTDLNTAITSPGVVAFSRNNVKGASLQRPYTVWAILPGGNVVDEQGRQLYDTETGQPQRRDSITFVDGEQIQAMNKQAAETKLRRRVFTDERFENLTDEQVQQIQYIVRDEWAGDSVQFISP